ncbi:MAG: hypothetical protein LBI10_08540 [Deltaproteobacteria bacterium]|jgi:serpin B|nr:hypothetical protein [Deltaproteobacteria bacterium]
MRRTLPFGLLLILALIRLTSAASADEVNPPLSGLLEVAKSETAFALELYAKLPKSPKNAIFSPASAYEVLALAREGARGATLSQLDRALRIRDQGGQTWAQKTSLLNQYLKNKGGAGPANQTVTLGLVSSLWPRQDLRLLPGYLKALGPAPPIFPLDYLHDGSGALMRINEWVAAQTKGEISQILTSPPGINWALIFVNAAYFLGEWAKPFSPLANTTGPFKTASAKDPLQIVYLNQTDKFGYLSIPEAQILELPYANKSFSLLILLPADSPEGLNNLETRLNFFNLENFRQNLKPTLVKVQLPRFRVDWNGSLVEPLKKLGLGGPFGPQADFSRLALAPNLRANELFHQAFFTVNEAGSQAASTAATTLATTTDGPTPVATFEANRPFIFLLQEKTTGAILLLGRLNQPAAIAED